MILIARPSRITAYSLDLIVLLIQTKDSPVAVSCQRLNDMRWRRDLFRQLFLKVNAFRSAWSLVGVLISNRRVSFRSTLDFSRVSTKSSGRYRPFR